MVNRFCLPNFAASISSFYEDFGSALKGTLEPINCKTWQKKYPAL